MGGERERERQIEREGKEGYMKERKISFADIFFCKKVTHINERRWNSNITYNPTEAKCTG